MKKRFLEKIPATIPSADLIFIVVIVLCSSLSFLLGYFVGKSRPPENYVVVERTGKETISGVADLQKNNILTSDEELTTEDKGSADMDRDTGTGEERSLLLGMGKNKTETGDRSSGDFEEEYMDTVTVSGLTGPQNSEPPEAVQEVYTPERKSKPAISAKKRRIAKAYFYTIQVGAFRDRKQASKLRNELRNKGYTAKIIHSGKGLFKVCVGRFRSKNDAEVFAIKLARIEKLKGFILKRKG
jgi:cell division protein FtsN